MRRNQLSYKDAERAELSLRNLIPEAWEIYGSIDPFQVYETSEGEYYIWAGSDPCWGPMTFDELESTILSFRAEK